jgi:hypothetical protein
MQTNRPGQITLSLVIVVGFFMILYYFLSLRGTLPADHRELIAGMIGALTMKFGSTVDFWFGANASTERTRDLLARARVPDDDCIELKNEVPKVK